MKSSRYFLSDLHLLSRRSVGDQFNSQIHQIARQADVVILGGDIFDFKWSTRSSLEASVEAGVSWLNKLLQAGQDTQFHYLLGNHDAHPGFVSALENLSSESKRQLQWHPHVLRLDESVFFHGDILDVGDCHVELDKYRAKKAKKVNASPASHAVYDAVVAANLHRAVLPVVQPKKRVLKKLTKYLDRHDLNSEQGVEHVFFGHTHRVMDGIQYQGLAFHNGGSTIRGLDFRIINVEKACSLR